jgi:predicted  nucleic acid-binding Zn-ribbon protein
MEHSAAVSPRVQLTLARLNIEEQRIVHLSSELEDVRRQIAAVSLKSRDVADRFEDIEKGLQTAVDEKLRKSFEMEQPMLKREQAAHARAESELRVRETEATQALAAEQNRWIELNARLDELERLLAPVR